MSYLNRLDGVGDRLRIGLVNQGGIPFQVAVQILSCDDQHNHHQEAPKHKEEGKDGLADPEDL